MGLPICSQPSYKSVQEILCSKPSAFFNSITWPSLLIVFATVKNVIISKWLVNLAASLA